jgi:hypothetical protein
MDSAVALRTNVALKCTPSPATFVAFRMSVVTKSNHVTLEDVLSQAGFVVAQGIVMTVNSVVGRVFVVQMGVGVVIMIQTANVLRTVEEIATGIVKLLFNLSPDVGLFTPVDSRRFRTNLTK